jgi:LEA14-like dessication related protein
MRHARFASLALAATLLAAGCAEVGKVIGAAFEKPRLTLVGWEPTEADLDGVTIALHWRIENPNGVGLKVTDLEYRLDVESHQAVSGATRSPIAIPSRGAAPFDLPLRVRYREVAGLVGEIFKKPELAWSVEGRVGIDTPVGPILLPFSHQAKVAAPRPPRLSLTGLSVHDIGLTSLTLDVRLALENPNVFPVPGGALSYALRVAGAEVASGATHPLSGVAPGKTQPITLPVRLSYGAAGEAARRAAAGEALDVVLRGQASFGGATLPVEIQGRLPPMR